MVGVGTQALPTPTDEYHLSESGESGGVAEGVRKPDSSVLKVKVKIRTKKTN